MKYVKCEIWFLLVLGVITLVGCDDNGSDGNENGEGTLVVETWGEEYIEQGIPADEFEDGFGVTYSKFLVVVGDVRVGDALHSSGPVVWNLAKEGPFEIESCGALAGSYSEAAYTIGPADEESVQGNASAEDLQFMIGNGYSVYVEGQATDETITKEFAWGFNTMAKYDPCHIDTHLVDSGTATVQLTIHGDHLFYDSAVSSTPGLRFAAIADADADDDGIISQEELQNCELAPLATHGVGSLDIETMWDYLQYMTTTLGHIDGEGHCEVN